MKQVIKIIKNDKEIFNGKIADIPIKKEYIVKKSIELFDDDDPCIIHQSYVVKEFVDVLLNIRKDNNLDKIHISNFLEDLDFIDYTELEKLIIIIEG
jgi:hypothetical protein